jgi:hypothetical protein
MPRHISANFNPGKWTEVVGKKGKRMRSKRFACSVDLVPSNNQAGTNLRSAHAVPVSHVMSGATKFESFYWICLFWSGCKKDSIHWKLRKKPPKEKLCEAWQQVAEMKHDYWKRVQRNNKRTFTELSKWLDKSSKELKAFSAYLLECQVEVTSQLFKAHYRNVVKDRAEIPKHTTMLNGT